MKAGLRSEFKERYGPWALVAGASEGLGEAFARELARRGLSLLLVSRRRALLQKLADELKKDFEIDIRPLALDLSRAGQPERLLEMSEGLPVGLYVHNAALSPIGPFLQVAAEEHLDTLQLNCRSALVLAHRLGAQMSKRGRGGLVLVSSLASFQGTAGVAHYAATKAYLRVLAEGLWRELRAAGIDVLASCPGLVDTPAFRSTQPRPPGWFTPPPLSPRQVACETLDFLGRGPLVIPGRANALACLVAQKLLPRRLSIALASAGTRRLYPEKTP